MANNSKYTFSFTGASALMTESRIIAEEYYRLNDWKLVEQSLSEKNLLNKIKQATYSRQLQEIKKRLTHLSYDQLKLLVNGDLDEAKAMILLSLVKTYLLLKDFIVEIIRNKYLLFDNNISEVDYTRFINAKSISHPELESITELTAKKIKQRVFTILEQIGLITHKENGIILKPIISKDAIAVILEDDPTLLSVFLFSNEEIKELLQNLKHAQQSEI